MRWGGAYSEREWCRGDYGIFVKVHVYPDKYITLTCFCCVSMLIYLFLGKKRCSGLFSGYFWCFTVYL